MSDAYTIINNYSEHLEYFYESFKNKNEKKIIIDNLNLSSVISACKNIGTKKGNDHFYKWQNKLLNKINELDRNKTIFDRLKSNRVVTVFDKIKLSRKAKK